MDLAGLGFVLDNEFSRRVGDVESSRVAGACGHQALDDGYVLNGAARADSGAVQSGGGAGKLELALERPALEKSVDEAGVKNIAGAGGVESVHSKSGSVMKLRAVPGEDTFVAQGCGGEFAAELTAEGGERLAQIVICHQPAGDVSAGDEVVDVFDERFHARIKIIEVGDDGDAGCARPACGYGCGGGVVPIQVKNACAGDPFALEFFGVKSEARVAFPEDGAFARVVNENESLLAGAAGGGEEMRLNAETRKFGAVNFGGVIVAQLSDVASAQAPELAGDHSSGDLSAGQNICGMKRNFRTKRGIVRKENKCVGGVEPQTDNVNRG